MSAPDPAADQFDAAARDAREVMLRTAESSGRECTTGNESWLKAKIASHILSGKTGHCPHLDSPAPALMMLCRPDKLYCQACFPRSMVLTPEEEYTCDRCGHLCAGTPEDPINVNWAQIGPLLTCFGICDNCK